MRIIHCVGKENIEWFSKKYRKIAEETGGMIILVHKIIEALSLLDGDEDVRNKIVSSLKGKNRDDLALIFEELLIPSD